MKMDKQFRLPNDFQGFNLSGLGRPPCEDTLKRWKGGPAIKCVEGLNRMR